MRKGVEVQVWGCRGSFPAAFADRMEYGGNTSCISVECGERMIIFDAGSGLIPLGRKLLREGRAGRSDIFLSHVHLDHIMGLYQYAPSLVPGAEIHLYGETREGQDLRSQLEAVIRPPYWPVGLASADADIICHEMRPGVPIVLGGEAEVEAIRSNHPNQGLLYRLTAGEKKIFYGLDCEMDETIWKELAAFGRGCDLLICDAQYRPEELEEKRGWGHSSWREGNALLRDCGAGAVWHAHYDWGASDQELREREKKSLREEPLSSFVKEGWKIQL